MFRRMLSSAIFGSPLYNVTIKEIEVRRTDFGRICDCHEPADISSLEQYGLAIHGAKDFKDNQWFYTDKGNLVCGNAAGLSTVLAKIVVDHNINFLAMQHHFTHGDMPKWYAVEVKIIGLNPEKGEQVDSGPFPLVFLGNAKK